MNKPPLTIRWDERYKTDEYVFGTEPNDFLAEVASQLPIGNVLCLADGEGRNGVYLAQLGHDVTSVDASGVALDKARHLARERSVSLTFEQADLNDYEMGDGKWDCCVSIFFHMPHDMRRAMHQKILSALRPGGYLILEAYTPAQLAFGTGGPPVEEMLMTLDLLREDFPELNFIVGQEIERDVQEGKGHAGRSSVVQLFAQKPHSRERPG